MPATVDILLGTYNGAAHVTEQLESLRAQTFGDWRLILRDDGSTDGTPVMVADWCGGNGIDHVILETGRNLGAAGNFGALLAASDAPYFCFCDQDDVWLPEKLSTLLDAVCEAERRLGSETPILAHSDLLVVDDDLRPVSSSYWRMLRADPAGDTGRRGLMLRNYVTGCASFGNAALARAALPVPDESPMHDWWLALVAAHCGELIDLPRPLVQYRQHGGNVLGAKDWGLLGILRRIAAQPLQAVARTRRAHGMTMRQAGCFAGRYGDRMEPAMAELFAAYGSLPEQPFLARKTFLLRHGYRLPSPLHTLIHWVFL